MRSGRAGVHVAIIMFIIAVVSDCYYIASYYTPLAYYYFRNYDLIRCGMYFVLNRKTILSQNHNHLST